MRPYKRYKPTIMLTYSSTGATFKFSNLEICNLCAFAKMLIIMADGFLQSACKTSQTFTSFSLI